MSPRKKILHPNNEKEYLSNKNDLLFAGTDIDLHDPQGIGYLTAKEIWADFTPDEPLDVQTQDNKISFRAKKCPDGDLRVQIGVYLPETPAKRAVLLVREYGKKCQMGIVEQLTKDGFAVFLPDYCGVLDDTLTSFPASLSYGKTGCGGQHMTTVCPTAKETCNYLYSLILRRSLTFIKQEYSLDKTIIVAIRSGVEYAMQVAGCDDRVLALACLGSTGYKELLSESYFKGDRPTLTPEQLAWMVGVSGATYLIGRDLPLFVGIGSNDSLSDPDRMHSLAQLVGEDNLRFFVCTGYSDNVDAACFSTLRKWLRLTFLDAKLPSSPHCHLNPNAEGVVYAEVKADVCSPICAASVCYAADDYNHETRNWTKVVCETVGKGEYIARIPITRENQVVFIYPEITYENGVSLTGPVSCSDFTNKNLVITDESSDNVIYSYGDPKSEFKESNEEPVLFADNLKTVTIPVGLKGICNPNGEMVLFIGEATVDIDEEQIFQIDCFSEDNDFTLDVYLTDLNGCKYYASKKMYTVSTFEAAMFSHTDFKDERFRPLRSWKTIKRFTVAGKNTVISRLLFV